jgi:hypothetical protein
MTHGEPVQACCVRSRILWDLAAGYSPGLTWSDRMPPAVMFNGPVVDVAQAIEAALVPAARAGPLLPQSSGGRPNRFQVPLLSRNREPPKDCIHLPAHGLVWFVGSAFMGWLYAYSSSRMRGQSRGRTPLLNGVNPRFHARAHSTAIACGGPSNTNTW